MNRVFFLAAGLCLSGVAVSVSADPAVDLSDVGEVYLQNNGAAEAQQPFLHGLAQLHNFEFSHAAQDFQRAREIDPESALAYWGEAMTHNHPIWQEQDREAALAVLDAYAPDPEARQAKAPTELARDLFAAIDVLYGEGDKQDRDDAYLAYMAGLFDKYPDHPEIASFYALAIMGSAHEGRDIGLYMQAAALMQNFIRDYPRHPGIAHYLIHATDDPEHAPLGLIAANAYGEIAPNAAHAQHMTTHIFLALGDWDGVVGANVRATAIMNEARAAESKDAMYCGHYPSWLMYGYLQRGDRDSAHGIMQRCHENAMNTSRWQTHGAFAWMRALYLNDTGEWDGDVARMRVEYNNPGPRFLQQIYDGWVALRASELDVAADALVRARESYKETVELWDRYGIPASAPFRAQPPVYLKQLEAGLSLARGDREQGMQLLHEAVAMERDMPFGFGPPVPAKPSLELLGESLLAAGKRAEAIRAFKQSLSRTPNRALSLAGLRSAASPR